MGLLWLRIGKDGEYEMKQYLYIDESDYDCCCPNIMHYTNILSNKDYEESELIEVDEFYRPMDSFGMTIDGTSYISFCNVLERVDGVMRNIIVMTR